MKANRDFDNQPDERASDMIIDMVDDLETVSLEEKISFLYEVTGTILMNAINLVEKDDRQSIESKD